MIPAKLITVFGVTGSQGGSVVNSLLKNKSGLFALRGITRNVESEKSQALAARGVEMKQANCLSKDQVVSALRGSWGVFVNTSSEDPVGRGQSSIEKRIPLMSLKGCHADRRPVRCRRGEDNR